MDGKESASEHRLSSHPLIGRRRHRDFNINGNRAGFLWASRSRLICLTLAQHPQGSQVYVSHTHVYPAGTRFRFTVWMSQL